MNDELIPRTEELNRLKEFLANFKNQPKSCDKWTDHACLGYTASVDNRIKNYGGPYAERP